MKWLAVMTVTRLWKRSKIWVVLGTCRSPTFENIALGRSSTRICWSVQGGCSHIIAQVHCLSSLLVLLLMLHNHASLLVLRWSLHMSQDMITPWAFAKQRQVRAELGVMRDRGQVCWVAKTKQRELPGYHMRVQRGAPKE
jgi:hypothetical protein